MPDIIGWYRFTPGPNPVLKIACNPCQAKTVGNGWRPAYSTSDYPGLSVPVCSYCGTDVGRDSDRIGQRELSEASRYNDARAEDIGLEATVNELGVDLSGLLYVAEQRALRMVLISQGRDPSKLAQGGFSRAPSLSSNERKMLALFQSCWLDALCVGVKAMRIKTREEEGDGT